MTEPNIPDMLNRYLYNRERAIKYRQIADRYEFEIIKILQKRLRDSVLKEIEE